MKESLSWMPIRRRKTALKTVSVLRESWEVDENCESLDCLFKSNLGKVDENGFEQVLRVLNELSWITTFVSNVVFSINANANLTHETRFQRKLVQKTCEIHQNGPNWSSTGPKRRFPWKRPFLAFGLKANFQTFGPVWEVLRGLPKVQKSVGRAVPKRPCFLQDLFKTCSRTAQTSQQVLEQVLKEIPI